MLLLLLFSFTFSYAATILNENNVSEIIGQNPDVQSLLKRMESAEYLKGKLTRSFLPKISLSYGREKFTTGPYYNANQSFGGIEAEINLFNSGKDNLQNKIIETNIEMSRIDAELMKNQIQAELKKAMSHSSYLYEIKKITTEAISQNVMNIRNAEKRINAGLATSTDLLDFRQQRIHLKQELASLDYEIGVTNRLINTLIGHDPAEAIELEYVNTHPEHSDESKLKVDGQSLLLKKVELEREVIQLELEKDKRWWGPSFDLFGYGKRFTQKEREYNPSVARNDVTIGFKFSFPVFDGGEGYRSSQSTMALVEAKKNEVRGQDLLVRKKTQDSLKKLELAHTLIHGAEENVQVMNEYRKGILNEYARGIKNSPDVLQANQRWIEAKISYAEVKKNYQFAKVEAEYLSSLQGH